MHLFVKNYLYLFLFEGCRR